MKRVIPFAVGWMSLLLSTSSLSFAADAFESHLTEHLKKGVGKQKPLASVAMDQAAKLRTLSKTLNSPCLVVRTNEGNWCKLLVSWGFRKSAEGGKLTPVLLLDRYVTYRADRGDVAAAAGKEVMLFTGFEFNLDIGQVVPKGQGGDIVFDDRGLLKPVGKAEIYALETSQLSKEAETTATAGKPAEPSDFAGEWAVDIDGRWKGTWQLKVNGGGRISGKFTSIETKSTYDVSGRPAAASHQMRMTIHLDNTDQQVEAYLWTTDKSTMAGVATLANRKFGFFARRLKSTEKSAGKPE